MIRPLGCMRTPSAWVLSHTGLKTAEVAGGKSITRSQGKMGTLFEAKTKDCDFWIESHQELLTIYVDINRIIVCQRPQPFPTKPRYWCVTVVFVFTSSERRGSSRADLTRPCGRSN